MISSNYTSDASIALTNIDILLIFVDHNQKKKNIKAVKMLAFCSDILWIFASITSKY